MLVGAIVVLSVREWILLLGQRRPPTLREAEPVWLPDYALAESKPLRMAGMLALGMALAKELSGEAQMERQGSPAVLCQCGHMAHEQTQLGKAGESSREDARQRYLSMTEQRFKGVRRCC